MDTRGSFFGQPVSALRYNHCVDIVLALVFVVYFVPSVRAQYRDHDRIGWIFALNLLLGWTGIGWVAAFVLAGRPTPPQPEPPVLLRRGHLRVLGVPETARACRANRAVLRSRPIAAQPAPLTVLPSDHDGVRV